VQVKKYSWLAAVTATELTKDSRHYDQMRIYENQIESTVQDFEANCNHLKNNRRELLNFVDKFLNENQKAKSSENLEVLFINQIDVQEPESLIKRFVKDMKRKDEYSKRESSQNRMVFDFYMSVLLTSTQMTNAVKFAYKKKAELNGVSYESLFESYVKEREKVANDKIYESLMNADALVDDEGALRSFVDIDPAMTSLIQIKFKNIVQTYFINEGDIQRTCKKQCEDYKYVEFNDLYCEGALMDCKRLNTFGSQKRYV